MAKSKWPARWLTSYSSRCAAWLLDTANGLYSKCRLVWGSRFRGLSLVFIAAAFFLLGVSLPFVRVSPGAKLGLFDGSIIWLLSDDESYSLLGSILAIGSDNWFIGFLAFAFSFVFPSVKLFILFRCGWQQARTSSTNHRLRKWAELIGPWSMLEVYLVGQSLFVIKALPFGTSIQLQAGFLSFAISVLASLLAACFLR